MIKYHEFVYNTIMRKSHCYHLTARLFGIHVSIVTDNNAQVHIECFVQELIHSFKNKTNCFNIADISRGEHRLY